MSINMSGFDGAFPEIMQEMERAKDRPPPRSVRLRLRRDDPSTKRLLAVFRAVCHEETLPSGLVRRRLVQPDGEERLFVALREFGIPIESLLPSAPQPEAQATAVMSSLLGVLGSVLPAARREFDQIGGLL